MLWTTKTGSTRLLGHRGTNTLCLPVSTHGVLACGFGLKGDLSFIVITYYNIGEAE